VRALLALCALAACSSSPTTAPDAGELDAAPVLDAAPEERGEMRAVWITRFAYSTQAQLEAIIDRAAAANFNAVFVQIRGEGDAFYRSSLEPWSRLLTGTFGRDPGWDPLQVAIDRAHAHGMELHAYFNVLSAWSASLALPQAEGPVQHALYTHPEWLAVRSNGTNGDTEYRWFSPGIPEVRAHIVAVATELLRNYEVDGLHLDRIRTPGPDYSHDAITQARFDEARAQMPSLTFAEFMRAQVDAMVSELYDAVLATRPSARLTAAVWGIHTPLPGCSTSKGFADYHQDSIGWLQKGIVDAIVPMMYWSIEPGACTDWSALLDGFVAGRGDRPDKRQVWAGMHALDANVWDFDKVRARIERSREVDAHGVAVYASSVLDGDPARWSAFVGTAEEPGPFAEPAPTPSMSWK
jgi:uncharacterized lipoprotein YddW (UPF0748 family)